MKTIALHFIMVMTLLSMGCKQVTKEPYDHFVDKKKIQNFFDRNPNNVLFNHLYVVLDSSTYNKFRSNMFLKESYSNLDCGMPDFDKINDTVNSVYLRDETHYLEVLGPNNRFEEPVGQIGIGFSIGEKESFSLKSKPKLKEDSTKFLKGTDTVSFKVNNKKQVWYKPFFTYGMKTNLYTWYSYYNHEFLEAIDGKKREIYTREDFLEKAYAPTKLFRDFISITLKCNRSDQYRIARELELLGCKLEEKQGENLTFQAGDIYLKLMVNQNQKRSSIKQIESRLNYDDSRTLQLDKITIKNEDKKSLWVFDESLW